VLICVPNPMLALHRTLVEMKITTPQQAFHYFQSRMAQASEEFWVVALNAQKRVLRESCLFRGTVDSCMFHPRDVFRFACLSNASSLLVAHNHPTGEPWPSEEDRRVTRQLLLAATLMQIEVVDHLILAHSGYYSFLQAGEITCSGGPGDQSLGRY
jgi:DNA repair protein RadC